VRGALAEHGAFMSEQFHRGWRRHHRQRLLNLRKKERSWLASSEHFSSPERYQVVCGMLAKTPKSCSCLTCGNPRHHWGYLTLAEKRSWLDFQEQDDG
jgi:hypothetical protein